MNRFAIVTGAANGIGRAIAARLARDGLRVALADIDLAAANRAANEISAASESGTHDRPIALQVDVADARSVEAMTAAALDAFGRIDVMVSNAGVMERAPFLQMTESFWRRVLDINLTGAFFCGQAAARRMVAQGSGGRIVNVASNSGIFGGRGRAAYGASKAGLINLTQTMAIELAEHGILVNAVAPGPTRTHDGMPAEPGPAVMARMPLARFGRPDEIAAVAAFLASNECSFTTGHVYCADGGFTIAGMTEA